jgi:hypothetical protein
MADVEWQPLPALWPQPTVWTDVGELMLLVFTQDGVPTWEVSRRAKPGSSRHDLIASGTADTFEAAKAATVWTDVGELMLLVFTQDGVRWTPNVRQPEPGLKV